MSEGVADGWAELMAGWPVLENTVAGIAQMAQYVAPQHIEQLGLRAEVGGARVERNPVRRNVLIVAGLYDVLRRRRYSYDVEPYFFEVGRQIVRHPSEVDRSAGTCIDFAVLFASLLLSERIAPILLVGVNTLSNTAHVWVAADLHGVDYAHHTLPTNSSDVLDLSDPAERNQWLARDSVLGVDVTLASDGYEPGDHDFESACESARRLTNNCERLWSVDVVKRQNLGFAPFPGLPANRRPAITRLLSAIPGLGDLERSDGARDEATRCLQAGTGTMFAVLGEPGMGKSLLALRVAAQAAGGFGWSVDASSPAALRESLARAESRQQYGTDTGITAAEFSDLATDARRRLEDANVPWVVVVDNANLSSADPVAEQAAILGLLPQPASERGQRIIVTSTHALWVNVVDETVHLGPVDDTALGFPASLRIEGRPLFTTAFDRLAASAEVTREDLGEAARSAPPSVDAADILWHLARSVGPKDHNSLVLRLGQIAAWAPPDSIEANAVCAAAGVPVATFHDLRSTGLVESLGPLSARMHRLVRMAISAEVLARDPIKAVETMAQILDSPIDLDAEALRTIVADLERVPRSAEADRALGRALCSVGARAETLLGVEPAAAFMAEALPLLAPDEVRRRADCYHWRGRALFQFNKSDKGLSEGLAAVSRSLELRAQAAIEATAMAVAEGEQVVIDVEVKHQESIALRGLILVQQAVAALRKAPDPTDPAHVAALELAAQGTKDIDSSLSVREGRLADSVDHRDLLRGRFNQAMSAVSVAQFVHEPVRRESLLATAEGRYGDVRRARERLRPRPPTPHIASCWAGQAFAEYLRGIELDPTTEPDSDHRRRDGALRRASEHLRTALDLRESLEPIDGAEVAKTVRLEAKIALARYAAVVERDGRLELLGELRAELELEIPPFAEGWFG